MKEITFRISLDGSVTIEAEGFQGQQCYDATQEFEQMFEIEESQQTADYYIQPPIEQAIKIKNGR